jgi:Cof subfamily protein (haloacid dehalogenase superfamily)
MTEAAPKYALVALDLDGTVIGNDLVVHPRVKDAVARAQAQGVIVAIVTGRMFSAARPFARTLAITGPIVCYQGAAIFDASSGERIMHAPVDNAVARRILAKTRADGVAMQFYVDDVYYVERIDEWVRGYAQLAAVEPTVVPDLGALLDRGSSTKCVAVLAPDRAERYVAEMSSYLGADAYVTRSHASFVEMMNPKVNKGTALALLAERYRTTPERTLAVGDSWNDLPLLEAAAFGVAMGSAPPELRARADAVVADVAHDGVAEAIERFVLA